MGLNVCSAFDYRSAHTTRVERLTLNTPEPVELTGKQACRRGKPSHPGKAPAAYPDLISDSRALFMSLTSLGLCPELLVALQRLGATKPTPIQREAVPAALQGRDVLGLARTGSGKTLAFALPVLQRCWLTPAPAPRQPRALVLVPTRELARQVGEVLRSLANALPRPIKVSVAFGGVSINPQLMGLRGGTDIMVATPGRLMDLLAHNGLSLSAVECLVLDEADRLLDLGFSQELQALLAHLPAQGQRLFFSATFPAEVQALADTLLLEPLRIEPMPCADVQPDITQRALRVDLAQRTQLLRHLVTQQSGGRVLVFVATKHAAEVVADKLRKANLLAEPLHSQLSQGKRNQVLQDFKAQRLQVLVATDLAARGLDIAELPLVVNYDLPRSADVYTHRIGRTGRAGTPGVAISFVTAENEAHFRLIEKRQQRVVSREVIAGFEPQDAPPPPTAPPGTGGVKGRRPSKKDKLRAAVGRSDPVP